MLFTTIIDEIVASVFNTQVKPSFRWSTFPIIFISGTFFYSNTLQPTDNLSFSALSPTFYHHLVPHPPSKLLLLTPDPFLYVAQRIAEEIQSSPSVVPHVACGLIPLNLLAKATTELSIAGILLLPFLYNFEFGLNFLYFSREVFDNMYEDLLCDYHDLPLIFLGKPIQWIWLYWFFHSYYTYLLGFFSVAQTIDHLNVASL